MQKIAQTAVLVLAVVAGMGIMKLISQRQPVGDIRLNPEIIEQEVQIRILDDSIKAQTLRLFDKDRALELQTELYNRDNQNTQSQLKKIEHETRIKSDSITNLNSISDKLAFLRRSLRAN